jgi:redox-sensitive bicupin YhaK (pirin superfamily)
VPAGFRGFVYVLEEVAALGSTLAGAHATQIVVLGEGGALSAQAGPEGARFVLAAGQPHREPVRFNGPYVG